MNNKTSPASVVEPISTGERNLVNVIDSITSVAPDLKTCFIKLRQSVTYTSPELMQQRWHEAAEILNHFANGHAKQPEISAIFSGSNEKSATVKAFAVFDPDNKLLLHTTGYSETEAWHFWWRATPGFSMNNNVEKAKNAGYTCRPINITEAPKGDA